MSPSEILGGRYELGEVIGSGGMATVYRGWDRVLKRPVAVKVLSSAYAGDEDFVARFRREARAAANLNNPGVVSVFDTGSDGGRHFIVMELVEGRTLAEEIAEHGALDLERARDIAERVAGALQFAHANGIVHRDVKPGNVMLTPSGEVKVMDFGIARAAGGDTLTTTSSVLGTANYLAPEQAESKPVDPRTDVYALGVVLYEMLTGRPPFTGETAISVAYKHVREKPRPPSSVNPEVPAALEAITLKALAKDPQARYQSAEEMRRALVAAGAGEVEDTALGATTPIGTGERTEAMAPVEPTSVLGPGDLHEAPPEPPPERRSIWPFVLGVVLVLAGAALAVALVAGNGGGGPSPARSPSHRPPRTSTPPTTPPPTHSSSPSVPSSPSSQPTSSPTPRRTTLPPPTPSLSPSVSPSAVAIGASPSPSPPT